MDSASRERIHFGWIRSCGPVGDDVEERMKG